MTKRVRGIQILTGALLFAATSGWASGAQQAQSTPAQPATQPEAAGQQAAPAQPGEGAESLHLLVGRSLVVSSPTRIRRVSIADPAIADTMVVNPNQVLINGKAPGAVSLVLWDESGQSQTFDVSVELDVIGFRDRVKAIYPNEAVRIDAQKDVLVLSGQASSPVVADKLLEMAKAAAPKAVSMIEIPAPTNGQIILEVKFAEVDRQAITTLGANILSLPPAKTIGSTSTQQFGPPQLPTGAPLTATTGGFQISDILNVFLFRPDINLAATIKALQNRNVLQILAEPNVLAESGKDANFLAGGEFPFPVIQSGTAGAPVVTIQWREFGVRLNFTPTLMPGGTIHLKVRPEVSSLDFSQALQIQGFLIPAISTRRVETEMDLREGQSFAIAGLVDNRVTKQLNKIPGIGDIPVLGKLFQSENLTKSRNELLVLVTPHIVQPYQPGQAPSGPRYDIPFMPAPAAPKTAPSAGK